MTLSFLLFWAQSTFTINYKSIIYEGFLFSGEHSTTMIFSFQTRNKLFIVFAILAALISLYHLIGVFYEIDESPFWRHGIFVCINLFFVYGILKRPKYFVFLVCILLVQQYYSHGIYLIKMWAEQQKVHWVSILDLILLPVALICLIEDYKAKRQYPVP